MCLRFKDYWVLWVLSIEQGWHIVKFCKELQWSH
jgi:hypothetical protein